MKRHKHNELPPAQKIRKTLNWKEKLDKVIKNENQCELRMPQNLQSHIRSPRILSGRRIAESNPTRNFTWNRLKSGQKSVSNKADPCVSTNFCTSPW